MSTGEHAAAADPGLVSTEPVALSEVVRYIVGLLAAAGWITISDETINIIITIIGAVVSLGLTWWSRSKVTPVAQPLSSAGAPLVTAAGATTPPTPPTTPQKPPEPPQSPPPAPPTN